MHILFKVLLWAQVCSVVADTTDRKIDKLQQEASVALKAEQQAKSQMKSDEWAETHYFLFPPNHQNILQDEAAATQEQHIAQKDYHRIVELKDYQSAENDKQDILKISSEWGNWACMIVMGALCGIFGIMLWRSKRDKDTDSKLAPMQEHLLDLESKIDSFPDKKINNIVTQVAGDQEKQAQGDSENIPFSQNTIKTNPCLDPVATGAAIPRVVTIKYDQPSDVSNQSSQPVVPEEFNPQENPPSPDLNEEEFKPQEVPLPPSDLDSSGDSGVAAPQPQLEEIPIIVCMPQMPPMTSPKTQPAMAPDSTPKGDSRTKTPKGNPRSKAITSQVVRQTSPTSTVPSMVVRQAALGRGTAVTSPGAPKTGGRPRTSTPNWATPKVVPSKLRSATSVLATQQYTPSPISRAQLR